MQFLAYVYHSFMQNQGLEIAKSLTFTSLFAVVPLITLVLAILSAFPAFQVFSAQLQSLILERLLPSSSYEIEQYFTEFASQARNLTWLGAVMLLVTSYLMLRSVEHSFNQIWGVSELRKGLTSFLLYWSVLSLGPLLLGVGLAITSYVTSLTLFERFSELSDVLHARSALLGLFPMVLTAGAFTLLYVAVPNCGVRFTHGLAGAIVVALAFKVVKVIFTGFIATASYEFVYGTFAVIPILLLWVYVCWALILFGANLVRNIPLFTTYSTAENVHPTLLLLALLHKFWEKQQGGEVLRIRELIDEKWPFRTVSVDKLLILLEELKLVRSLDRDQWILTRDLEVVSLWEVLSATPWAQPGPRDLAATVPPVIARHLPDTAALMEQFLRVAEVSGTEFATSFSAYFRDAAGWTRQTAQGGKEGNLISP
jgi:membrane protein